MRTTRRLLALLPLLAPLSAFSACRMPTAASVAPHAEPSVVAWDAGSSLRTIAKLIAQAERGTLAPVTYSPMSTSRLDFRRCARVDGRLVWDPLERIELESGPDADSGGRVVWVRRAGAADEQRILLCEGVAPLAEGELPNGMDDNGNGLIDEPGLSFVVEHGAVTARLSLRDSAGTVRTAETTVQVEYSR